MARADSRARAGSGGPHAFASRAAAPARMLFLVSPPGHERYLQEIGELVGRPGPPDPAAIAGVRARADIEQLTPMVAGPPRWPGRGHQNPRPRS